MARTLTGPEEEINGTEKIVVLTYPPTFSEDEVMTLMDRINSDLKDSKYRAIFIPKEVDFYFPG